MKRTPKLQRVIKLNKETLSSLSNRGGHNTGGGNPVGEEDISGQFGAIICPIVDSIGCDDTNYQTCPYTCNPNNNGGGTVECATKLLGGHFCPTKPNELDSYVGANIDCGGEASDECDTFNGPCPSGPAICHNSDYCTKDDNAGCIKLPDTSYFDCVYTVNDCPDTKPPRCP